LENFFLGGVLWHLVILTELLINLTTSKTHVASIFDLKKELVQTKTPLIASVSREVQERVSINEAICIYDK